MSKRRKIDSDDGPLSFNPFAALGSRDGAEPTSDQGSAFAQKPEPEAEPEPQPGRDVLERLAARRPKVVVRRQKKGQGGKTVTCVEGLDADLARHTLPRLKRELGCSGRVDGVVLIAGTRDHRRVAEWFRGAGARVTLGN